MPKTSYQIGGILVRRDVNAKCWLICSDALDSWLPLPFTLDATLDEIKAHVYCESCEGYGCDSDIDCKTIYLVNPD